MFESERLARKLFERSALGQQSENLDLLHPEVEIAPRYDTSITVSRAELEGAPHVPRGACGPRGCRTQLLADRRRAHHRGGASAAQNARTWISYRSAVWALIFLDGLLYRSWCVASVHEAEVVLVSSSRT